VKRCIVLLSLLLVFAASHAYAQQPAAQSHSSYKYRTILGIAGAAGGFATGFAVARVTFDLPDSRRQVWTAAAMSGAVVGAGGYLIGWAIDSRRNRNRISFGSDKFRVDPMLSADTRGLQFSVDLDRNR
jgi:hypothetical protein